MCHYLFFLGNRYGTKYENENSITALEIDYAISKKFNCLFYFRNIENKKELNEKAISLYLQVLNSNDERFKEGIERFLESIIKE